MKKVYSKPMLQQFHILSKANMMLGTSNIPTTNEPGDFDVKEQMNISGDDASDSWSNEW